jgi:hypothetical protein
MERNIRLIPGAGPGAQDTGRDVFTFSRPVPWRQASYRLPAPGSLIHQTELVVYFTGIGTDGVIFIT